jgi:hydroxypyruvate reductase
MLRSPQQLREDARAIWNAGVQAVLPETLVPEFLAADRETLWIAGEEIPLASIGRILVVGGGKAGAAMTVAVERVLGPRLLADKQVGGWVNVPADCLTATAAVTLHPARPAGVNEPTEEGAAGAAHMLAAVAALTPRDMCLVLLSGGGSALLPAPAHGLSLADKRQLTRALSSRGAAIEQLNSVRRELSLIKGGGLARACRAGRLDALVLSDVLGDDLSLIASGPALHREPTPDRAAAILREFGLQAEACGERALAVLDEAARAPRPERPTCRVRHVVIGNNATAVDAAGMEAERRGYSHAMHGAKQSEGEANDVGARHAALAAEMRRQPGPDCLITGGEPRVTLAPAAERGLGGRNQQLCLAALATLDDWRGVALLSGGTDGEDGPTDAAGAMVDETVAARARALGLDPRRALARNDAYPFFAQTEGLLKTGPTHTNVCDLRVVTVSQPPR